MMQPTTEEDIIHDQLPEVDEYKASIGYRSKSVSPWRRDPTEKSVDPEGEYQESMEWTHDVATEETYESDWPEDFRVSPEPISKSSIEMKKPPRPCFWKACAILCTFILAIVVATSVLVVSSTDEPLDLYHWVHGDTDQYASVKAYISEVRGISPAEKFEDTSSPQYLAAQWMAHGDEMKLPVPTDRNPTYDERYVMAVLYFATGGERWEKKLGFLSGAHICTWYDEVNVQDRVGISKRQSNTVLFGVHGCEEGAEDDELYPPNNLLTGSIPDEIEWLQRLENLNLEFNSGLKGTLPPGLMRMDSLTHLILQWCDIEGTIPPEIGQMSKLEYLGLGNNQFTGVIPTEIGKLTRLELLGLDNNVLNGNIDILAPLVNLKSLYLENNYIGGSISEDLMMGWPDLEELDVSDCTLTGQLPTNLFNHDGTLKVINLHSNDLVGPLPEVEDEDNNLEFLALNDNTLSGIIPESWTSFKSLKHLDLSRNAFISTLPERFGEMTNLEYLFVGDNELSIGEVPKFLIELKNLRELSMKDCFLTGTIPDFLEYLSNLQFLDFRKCNKPFGPNPLAVSSFSFLTPFGFGARPYYQRAMNWRMKFLVVLEN
eukprot:scaffold5817_cov101-Cylindrotheca_fusiformis.AAC.6